MQPPAFAVSDEKNRWLLRRMAELEPRTLAPMHGSCHEGDAGAVLRRWPTDGASPTERGRHLSTDRSRTT